MERVPPESVLERRIPLCLCAPCPPAASFGGDDSRDRIRIQANAWNSAKADVTTVLQAMRDDVIDVMPLLSLAFLYVVDERAVDAQHPFAYKTARVS
jgi:hypothetical protein